MTERAADGPTFATLLRRHRLAAALSQEALAERAGLSVKGISALERGQRTTPRLETAQLLAEALGLPPAERAAFIAAARPAGATEPMPTPARAPSPPPILASRDRPPPLPAPPGPLIGRQQEERDVRRLLDDGARLVTLTGPGGVGKTRLALAVAQALQDAYAGGAAFIGLATLHDAGLVLATIAQTLGVRATGDQGAGDLLRAYLRDKQLLLALDNLEQLLDAAPALGELLADCPRLAILATSRTALRVRMERQYSVPPLALPALPARQALSGQRPLSSEAASAGGAVAMFVERARAVRSDFELNEANADAVARVCQRLDGLPLAIELAAARIKVLSPLALLARLERRLPVLVDGPRDLPERQRTLRATMEWSHALLDAGEQRLFARLAVFVGGCTLEAVEAVCDATAPPTIDALQGLSSLADKSLLRIEEEPGGEPRFTMLETIREYALERLAASGAEETARRAHAASYMALAETAREELTGARQALWLARLERDHDNLRAALRWAWDRAAGTGDDAGLWGLRIAGALWRFWWTHDHLDEGARWLETLLARARSGDESDDVAVARGRALDGAGGLAFFRHDYDRAEAYFQECLALMERLGNRRGVAQQLDRLGIVARERGDYARAVELHETCLSILESVGSAHYVAYALGNLGLDALAQGDDARAAALIERCLAMMQDLGDTWGIAKELHGLGLLAREQGDDARATTLLERSAALFQSIDYKGGTAQALDGLGGVAMDRRDYVRAERLYMQSLALAREAIDIRAAASCVRGLGMVAAARGSGVRATQLFAAADAWHSAIGAPLWAHERRRFDQAVSAVEGLLGREAFARAWSLGQAAPAERIMAMALDREESIALTGPGATLSLPAASPPDGRASIMPGGGQAVVVPPGEDRDRFAEQRAAPGVDVGEKSGCSSL